MNATKLSPTDRLRLAALRLVTRLIARLFAWAAAPNLRPAPAAARRSGRTSGQIIDGECRRIDRRPDNRW